MKKAIIAAALLLVAVAAHAGCPVEIPAENRTLIVECTDGTYAVQWLELDALEWLPAGTCGLTLLQARSKKTADIIIDKAFDAIICPTTVKEPVVVVE